MDYAAVIKAKKEEPTSLKKRFAPPDPYEFWGYVIVFVVGGVMSGIVAYLASFIQYIEDVRVYALIAALVIIRAIYSGISAYKKNVKKGTDYIFTDYMYLSMTIGCFVGAVISWSYSIGRFDPLTPGIVVALYDGSIVYAYFLLKKP